MVELVREALELVGLETSASCGGDDLDGFRGVVHTGKTSSSICSYSSGVKGEGCGNVNVANIQQHAATSREDFYIASQKQVATGKPKPKLTCCVLS